MDRGLQDELDELNPPVRHHASVQNVVVAASGPSLHTFNTDNGDYISTWPPSQIDKTSSLVEPGHKTNGAELLGPNADDGYSDIPRKRRKLSSAREDSGSSAEIVVQNEDEIPKTCVLKQGSYASVIKLASDLTGRYVIAVTGEDKTIRVFELSKDGKLSQFSQRTMPKRPCAITMTPDNSDIICADKFGDVYSLPLLGQTIDSSISNVNKDDAPSGQAIEASPARFTPSATSLTVHTRGNRAALKQQEKAPVSRVEKMSFKFDHELILGHVSLLTDVICASIGARDYLLTSDRDEHIRISRAKPQTHITEGYCLGHTEFVSKLCLFPTLPHLLLSGGGDDYLILWNWRLRTIQQQIDLRSHVESFWHLKGKSTTSNAQKIESPEAPKPRSSEDDRFAVANIVVTDIQSQIEVIITCEGIPALFFFSLGVDEILKFDRLIVLDANVIDVLFLRNEETVLYSMDTVHRPLSMTTVNVDGGPQTLPSVGLLTFGKLGWERRGDHQKHLIDNMEYCLAAQPDLPQNSTAKGKSMKELLYSLQSLRKRDAEE
ncbi:tRNA (guanine-N(7)-)-methyltransferase non-catalytic subunit trm82 [Lecanora helva]